jgi:hypothetical protein
VVVASFLELVAAAEWFELLKNEERTTTKVAMLTVLVGIATLGLELLGSPSVEAAKNSDEVGLALWRR